MTRKALPVWNLENIKVGFDLFISEHGRLPTALEVDSCDFLPSSRQIQRAFGGLPFLRKKLGYDDFHFGAGESRSQIALSSNLEGLIVEKKIEIILVQQFGEPFVHVEKKVGSGRNRVDFYVYSPSGNFAIDVFHTNSFHALKSNMNVKLRRQIVVDCPMLYVLPTDEYSQQLIDSWVKVKTKQLADNQKILSYSSFRKFISKYNAYSWQ